MARHTPTPPFFNAELGISPAAPAVQLGLWNSGTRRGTTDNHQDIGYLLPGRSLPNGRTRFAASYYVGNAAALKSSAGAAQNKGYMVAIDHQSVPGRWVLAADYASGRNIIGVGGIGVYYYFTANVSLLTGPVWFNDHGINVSAKATVQLDISF